MDEPPTGGKGPAGDTLAVEPEVFAFAERFEALGVSPWIKALAR